MEQPYLSDIVIFFLTDKPRSPSANSQCSSEREVQSANTSEAVLASSETSVSECV